MYEPEETFSTSMVPPQEVIWWVAVSWLEDNGRAAEVSAPALKYSHISTYNVKIKSINSRYIDVM